MKKQIALSVSKVALASFVVYELFKVHHYLAHFSRLVIQNAQEQHDRFEEIERRIVDEEVRTLNLGMEVFGKGDLKRKKGSVSITAMTDKLNEGLRR